MKTTLKSLIFAIVVFVLLDITYIWVQENYGLRNWISPKSIKFWAKNIALLLACILYFLEKKKK